MPGQGTSHGIAEAAAGHIHPVLLGQKPGVSQPQPAWNDRDPVQRVVVDELTRHDRVAAFTNRGQLLVVRRHDPAAALWPRGHPLDGFLQL